MSTTALPTETPLLVDDLRRLLVQTDPSVLLVHTRILRRIIKEDRHIDGLGLQVPHRKSYWLSRENLLAIAQKDELGLSSDAILPDEVSLLPIPDQSYLSARPRSMSLVKYWRLLFHIRLDRHFQALANAGRLSEPIAQTLIQRIGRSEFAEVRQVLHHERFLFPPETDLSILCEFLASYLELRWFNRAVLPFYFPSFENFDEVDRIAAELVDAEELYRATRLPGAPDPTSVFSFLEDDREELAPRDVKPPLDYSPAPLRFAQFQRLALIAAGRGNNARSAILHTRAQHAAPSPKEALAEQQAAFEEIERLTARLATALELHHHEAEEWRHRLPSVLASAASGLFPAGARFLFDLQKVCIDHERDLFAADLVGWAVSWFRRPIQRPLPEQREVLLVKHLRAAFHRLSKIQMEDDQRRKLSILIRAAMHHREERVRERFRPILNQTFDEVGLLPVNAAERLARRKLIEELLDRVIERGFFTIGDLRDAISRNQLKLNDLKSASEFIWGDAVILLNRRLAERLDGVYRSGEIYMRILQRGSSLAFGTVVGRWLMLYLILPFVAAFGTVVCFNEFYHLGELSFVWTEYALERMIGEEVVTPSEEPDYQLGIAGGGLASIDPPPPEHELTTDFVWTAILGVFFLGLMISPALRAKVFTFLIQLWHWIWFIIAEGPQLLRKQPLVQHLLNHPLSLLFQRYALRPLFVSFLFALFIGFTRLPFSRKLILNTIVLVLSAIVFNTNLWRLIEESGIDWIARNWHWLHSEFVPSILRAIVWAFKQALDFSERILYTVDEWLRFRSGQSSTTFYLKVSLGLIWFLATYLIRVIINLFVEPTFNPIKHFPSVTIAAKLIIPLYLPLFLWSKDILSPIMGDWLAGILFSVAFLLFPGIAGFIAWEFKENWRLYRANRSNTINRTMIGHHGERMVQFFRPGFHSGTVRKLYAKIRKAARHADGLAFHKQREQLLHVEESLQHFVVREFLMVLEESQGWTGMRIRLGSMLLGTNRVEWELCHSDPRTDSLWLAFEEREGWLLARVAHPGWLDRLTPAQRGALTNALAGFYKLAGVELIEEQIRALIPAEAIAYDVRPTELVAWLERDFSKPLTFPLEQPDPGLDGEPITLPIPLTKLLYSKQPLSWSAWVETWENDRAGKLPAPPVLPEVRLLPQ